MSLWPLKIAAKLVLSRLPFDYRVWKKLGLFELGQMDTAAYALKVFRVHQNIALPNGMTPGATILELGCGDSLASALIAAAYGAGKIYLVDIGAFASTDIALYKNLADELRAMGLAVPDISGAATVDDMLRLTNAVYLTDGIKSLQSIPAHSVDFIWSHSVLEHVRLRDFSATFAELQRLMKADGLQSHNVNLKDHLADALNNLRFSEKIWESEFFSSSGFYTNRLRYAQMADIFDRLGYRRIWSETGSWPALPTPRARLARPYRDMPEDVLKVRSYHVVLGAPAT